MHMSCFILLSMAVYILLHYGPILMAGLKDALNACQSTFIAAIEIVLENRYHNFLKIFVDFEP